MNKRFISWVLVSLMLVTMVPATAFATSPSTTGVSATKSIKSGDYNEKTGEATITLTASGQDQINTSGVDVIMVVDESESMDEIVSKNKVTCGCTSYHKKNGTIFSHSKFYCCDCDVFIKKGPQEPGSNWACTNEVKTSRMIVAKTASKNFVNRVIGANPNNKIAIIGFDNDDSHKINFTSDVNALDGTISQFYARNTTNYKIALNKAIEFADGRTDKSRPLYIVMMSDGQPNSDSVNGKAQADILKGSRYNATIYSVGIALNDKDAKPLMDLASIKDGNTLYSNVSNSNMDSDLEKVLNTIKGEITTTYSGTDAVMTDVVNSQHFDYIGVVEGTGITTAVDSQGNTVVTWNIGILTGTKTAKIKVRLKEAYRQTGENYNTNKDVYLTFTNADGVTRSVISKSQIGDPQVTTTASKYDVSYSYSGTVPSGAPKVPEVQSIAQGTKNVKVATIPAIGTKLNGYTFIGWTTKDVTVTNEAFTMPNKAVAFTGTWVENEKFTVKASIDNSGTINGATSPYSEKFESGTTCKTLDFVPAANYHIIGVTVNDVADTNFKASGYKYVGHELEKDVRIVVTTTIDQFTITASAIGTGTISSIGAITVNAGGNAKFTITPDSDSYLKDVKIDGISDAEALKHIIGNGSYTFQNVLKNSTIEAVFEAKTVVMLKANGGEFIYTGKEQSVQGFSTVGLSENLTIAGITAGAKGINANEYVVTFNGIAKVFDGATDVTRKYTIKTNNDSKLIIKKRTIELKADSVELPFNNSEQAVTTYTILGEGLAEGQTVSAITINGKGTLPGEYTVTISAVEIGGNQGNYDIKYTPGKLKITPLDMSKPIKAEGYVGIYDGKYHGITVTGALTGSHIDYKDDVTDVEVHPNKYVNVGKYTVTYIITKQGYTDVTGSAVVTIKPATLTITADSASKTYDGKALTDSGWNDVSPAGIIAGDIILYVDVTGSAINVGTVPNVASKAVIARLRILPKSTVLQGISKEASQPISEEQLKYIREEVDRIVKDYKKQHPNSTLEEATRFAIKVMEGLDDVTSNYAIEYKPGVLTITSAGGNHHHHDNNNTTIIDEAVPLAGTLQLNKTDHFNYVKGYDDGNVKPLNNITREEVATIFYRLLTDASRAMYFSQNENFSDIASSRWSLNSIATLANGEVLTGYKDGTFGAAKPITRAEFAAIASRFDALELTNDNQFSDVSNHWAKSYINSAAKKGWINGYEDGTFKPDQYITRAEAMTLINKVLERRVDATGLMNGYKVFPDNKENDWCYYQVIEATNNHKYADRKNMSDMEKWTEILRDKTWNE